MCPILKFSWILIGLKGFSASFAYHRKVKSKPIWVQFVAICGISFWDLALPDADNLWLIRCYQNKLIGEATLTYCTTPRNEINAGIEQVIGWQLHLGAVNILVLINTLTHWELRGDIRNCLLSIIVFLNDLIIHDQWMVQTLLRCLISVYYIAVQHLQRCYQCATVWWFEWNTTYIMRSISYWIVSELLIDVHCYNMVIGKY